MNYSRLGSRWFLSQRLFNSRWVCRRLISSPILNGYFRVGGSISSHHIKQMRCTIGRNVVDKRNRDHQKGDLESKYRVLMRLKSILVSKQKPLKRRPGSNMQGVKEAKRKKRREYRMLMHRKRLRVSNIVFQSAEYLMSTVHLLAWLIYTGSPQPLTRLKTKARSFLSVNSAQSSVRRL